VSVNRANQAKASDRSDPSACRANKPRTLGLERIGLISLRFSLFVGLAAIVLLIAAVFGLARIKVDDSLSQLFRSDTPEFKTFEEVTRRFPSNEFDVLIVVEGKSLLDRASIEKHIYGRTGIATGNFLNNPQRFASKNTHWEFNTAKANELLEKAGWTHGPNGIRAKDGKQLKLVFQTSTNAPRQKTQAIVKQACQKAGIEVELKSVTASVYFSSDMANPDTNRKFYADVQMYNTNMGSPDPEGFMRQFLSSEIASKDNKWQGRNITRWRSEDYDNAFHAAESELDPVKRAALFIKMNDLVVGDPAVIPVVYRPGVSGLSRQLRARLSSWDNALWDLASWYRET